MDNVSQMRRGARVNPENRFTACHVDNLGNLHIVNQIDPSTPRTSRPYSQPSQIPLRTRTRTKTVRFSLENYSNSARSSANKPLPSFFQLGLDDAKPLPGLPNPDLLNPQRKPVPPPKDHFAQVLECKRVSIQRLKTPKPRRFSPRIVEEKEDVVALVRVYRPPRRVRIHWLRVLKDQRRLAFPIVLILLPTKKMPDRISKVLVVGQGRRPGTYEEPADVDLGRGGERMTWGADMKFSRRPKSTPDGRRPRMVVPEAPRRISTPDLPHPGTKWME